MSVHHKWRFIPALFIVAAVSLLISCAPKADLKQRPNVLFLFADDQRADALGCAGNSIVRTPNIDALASHGVRFRNAYVMGGHHGAICAPSRAMLMSGKSLFHVYDKLKGVTTMPQYFAEQGDYETFGTGKWHNEMSSFEASFAKGRNIFANGMSDHFNVPCRDLVNGKLTEPVLKSFSTDLFADAAMDFLRNYSTGTRSKPFFCYIAFTAPHDPRSPRKDMIGTYSNDSMVLPGNFMPFHPFRIADIDTRDENLVSWPRKAADIKSSLADYYAMITHLDSRVGDIIGLLKDNGLYENTIIVYAADNGLAIGSHGLMGKQNLYEHSTNVPFIIRGPGIPQGEESNAFIYLFDVFPTLASLCNLPAPQGLDGEDFTPVLTHSSEGRESMFTAFRNTSRAVRTREWKLIRYQELDYSQLFNLKEDPLELKNLAEDESFQPKVKELTELMIEWQHKVDDKAPFTARTIEAMDYDPAELEAKRKPDEYQPRYTLDKYFK